MRNAAFLYFLAALAAASATTAGTINEPLRATLLQMGRDDQAPIQFETADPARQPTPAEIAVMSETHRRNSDLIRQIVEKHGWPGISVAGKDGSNAAWLVVQHMDTEPEFQERCLALMQEAYDSGEVLPQNLAYLTDRVLTHQGKPQMYGTQGLGVASPDDEARIDRNRAGIGLEPWRVAVEKRKKFYADGYGGAVPTSPAASPK